MHLIFDEKNEVIIGYAAGATFNMFSDTLRNLKQVISSVPRSVTDKFVDGAATMRIRFKKKIDSSLFL